MFNIVAFSEEQPVEDIKENEEIININEEKDILLEECNEEQVIENINENEENTILLEEDILNSPKEKDPLIFQQKEILSENEEEQIFVEEPVSTAISFSEIKEEIEEEPEQIIIVEEEPIEEVTPIKEEITVMEQRSSAPMMLQSTEPPVVENTPSYPFAVTYHFYYRNSSNVQVEQTWTQNVTSAGFQASKAISYFNKYAPTTVNTENVVYNFTGTWITNEDTEDEQIVGASDRVYIKGSEFTEATDLYYYAVYTETYNYTATVKLVYRDNSGEWTTTEFSAKNSLTVTAQKAEQAIANYQVVNSSDTQYTFTGWDTAFPIELNNVSQDTEIIVTAQYDEEALFTPTATVHIQYLSQIGEQIENTISNPIGKGVSWTINDGAFDDDIDLTNDFEYNGTIYHFTGWDPALPFTISNLEEDTDFYFVAQYETTGVFHLTANYVDQVANGSGSWYNQDSFKSYGHTFKIPADIPDHYTFLYWENGEIHYNEGDKFTIAYADLTDNLELTFNAVYSYQPSVTLTYHYNNTTSNIVNYSDIDIYANQPENLKWFDENGNLIPEGTLATIPESIITTTRLSETKNVDVYAKYFDIYWVNDNGAALYTSSMVPYGELPEYKGEPPVKAATPQYTYTFAGWDKEIVPATESTTYTATYTAKLNDYTITFVDDNNTQLSQAKYPYGTTSENIVKPNPSKAETDQYIYAFTGWDKEIVTVTQDATYKATYKATLKQYTIIFVDYNNKVLSSQKYNYGTLAKDIKQPTVSTKVSKQYTYTFAGWDRPIETVTKDATYTATYKATLNRYKVIFRNDNGAILSEAMYAYGSMPSYNGTPTKASNTQYTYTFSGWDKPIVKVTENAIYTATYKANAITYKVTFLNYDGKVLSENRYAYGTKANQIKQPNASRPNTAQYTYSFAGWDKPIVDVYSDAVYIAVYTSNMKAFTVIWVDDNGTVLETDLDVPYGTTPTYNGTTPFKVTTDQYTYTFIGWTPAISPVTSNIVYTAQYNRVAKTYSVTFLPGEHGTFEAKTTYVNYGDKLPTPPEATGNEGYVFAGWDKTLEEYVYGNLIYTAQWKTVEEAEIIIEEIDDTETPLASFEDDEIVEENYWALVNLILLVFTIFTLWKGKKKKYTVFTPIAILAALGLFIWTENVHNPMIWVDRWTIWQAVIYLVGLLSRLLAKKEEEEEEETDEIEEDNK